jgi:hypothetical protein
VSEGQTKGTKIKYINESRSQTLASDVRLADTWLGRLQGLLFRKQIGPGEGLFLAPCNSIHMFGMIYPIDAIFVDRKNVVVGLVRGIKPWRMSSCFFKAESCLELPAGTVNATGTALGDQLTREDS